MKKSKDRVDGCQARRAKDGGRVEDEQVPREETLGIEGSTKG